jgi:phosphoglucomutase
LSTHPLAGKLATESMLVNVPQLVSSYFNQQPDPSVRSQRVAFGTSGHRGSSLNRAFNEDHILAVCQALAEHRAAAGIDGPLFLAMDTHALSEPAHSTALEVFAAHGITVRIAADGGYTPTPLLSHAVVCFNRGRTTGLADGVVITPSHNPPADGGFKYNPPHGGPADGDVAGPIERRANELLESGNSDVRRVSLAAARDAATTELFDYITPYVEDLGAVIDMEAIAASGLRIGVDPMGGSGIDVWEPLAARWKLDITVVNTSVDPTFRFVRVDRDGKIRMDCSSPWAMAGLVELKDRFDIAFGNDTDYDRHGIVTPSAGLMNPNHFLAVCIEYLFQNRPQWPSDAAIGKTLVSSSMIDRVVADMGRTVCEVPVGFKWFVPGLADGSFGFGGEESAGASFLRRDGSTWTTDKDGILLDLLGAEITAVTGADPGQRYEALTERFGRPVYQRIDSPANVEQKAKLKALSPEQVQATELAGEPIVAKLTRAPGNDAAIGGLKVVTENGWFAARPSGTEDVYKIYAESFLGDEHLAAIQDEARAVVSAAFEA